MSNYLINFLIVLISFFFMEFVAWFTHKYIMHGFLWFLHKDHHIRENKNFLQKNDSFFLIFAIPGAYLTIHGAVESFSYLFWIGLGITLYGFTYFLIHEVYIHRRFSWIRNINLNYFLALRRAHKDHHKHIQRIPGENFGLLIVPKKYFKEVKIYKYE